MALFIGFLIILGLLVWAIRLKPLGIILCSLFAYFLISRDNTPQTEIGWIMLAVMLVGIVINLVFYRKKRSYEC
ncbi:MULTISPECIES: hypothetical protein [Campylobacter]|uniref:hypothetical protein n=1 Tax=Campylobacter TaxID=194 RepID=UPI000A33C032|nr:MULTISPECIES: hypothetical protein [unclassified Campylobacter]MDY2763749.1 hypothetical protein [Campylobacter sp.]